MEVKYPKILIGSPMRDREEILEEYLHSIYNLSYPKNRIDLFWILNNVTIEYLKIMNNFIEKYKDKYSSISCEIFNFEEPSELNINRQKRQVNFFKNVAFLRNRMIDKAKEINTDYFLSIDSDIFIPDNFLEDLLKHDKDFIAGLVKNSPFKDAYNFMFWNDKFKRFYRKDVKLNGLIEVDLTGAAVLMSKKVISSGAIYKEGFSGSDHHFCLDLKRKEIKQWVDCDLKCKHVYNIKKYMDIGEYI